MAMWSNLLGPSSLFKVFKVFNLFKMFKRMNWTKTQKICLR